MDIRNEYVNSLKYDSYFNLYKSIVESGDKEQLERYKSYAEIALNDEEKKKAHPAQWKIVKQTLSLFNETSAKFWIEHRIELYDTWN